LDADNLLEATSRGSNLLAPICRFLARLGELLDEVTVAGIEMVGDITGDITGEDDRGEGDREDEASAGAKTESEGGCVVISTFAFVGDGSCTSDCAISSSKFS
jgi:hypothetical protein